MKIAFLQTLPVTLDAYMILSACLKKKNFDTEVFISAFEHDICKSVIQSRADMVAFNTLTGSYNWALDVSRKIKKIKNIPVILGGCHPTLYPETIDFDVVDYICMGEGEGAIVELAEAISSGAAIENIKNLAYRRGGELRINPVRPLIKDLGTLPFLDRQIYHKYKSLRNMTVFNYKASRCCPYSCAFCSMKNFSDIYNGENLFRKYPVEYVIEELSNIKRDYKNLHSIFFSDEIFGIDKKWAVELIHKYRERIGLPYTITTRANTLDDDFIGLLKETKCDLISISVETANEELRSTVLNKKISNRLLLDVGEKIYRAGIKTRVNCIFCLPDETLEDAFDNIRLMKKMKTTDPVGFLLQPFPKTGIYNYAVEKGYIDTSKFKINDLDPLVYFRTPINIPNKEKIIIVQELFVYACKIPYFDILLKKVLVHIPDNFIYKLLQKIGIAFSHKKFYKLSYWRLIKYLFAARKLDATASI